MPDNLTLVRDYVAAWKAAIDRFGVYVVEPKARTFDSVAFSLLNKAYRLSQACLALLDLGYVDEAFAMSRSIIECSLNLRYMTLDPDQTASRANNFVDFVFCEKKHFLEQCRKYLPPGKDRDDVESFAASEGIELRWASLVPDRMRLKNLPLNDWKLIEGEEWNGWKIATEPHPIDHEINKSDWIRRQFAADYRGSSAMVHCTIRAIDNVFAEPGIPFRVGENLRTTFEHSIEPLIIIVTNLFVSARYAFFGANLDGTEYFDKLFEDASSKLNYERQS